MTGLNLNQQIMVRVIDTETTGLEDTDAIVEIGYVDLVQHGGGEWSITAPVSILTNPGRPIPPEARAVHHISDADVADAVSPATAFGRVSENGRITHWAAHNAEFDRKFFGGNNHPWICTLKAAYRALPGAPAHNNQTLRYLLDLDDFPDFDPAMAYPPHRAGADAYVTAHLLRFILDAGKPVETLADWCAKPGLLPRLNFGKHRGTPWAEVPIDYLEWLTRQRDMDADAKFTARHWIDKRSTQGTTPA